MNFYEKIIDGLNKLATNEFKNPRQLADYLGVEPNLITRWLNKDRVPRLDTLGEVMDKLGVSVTFPFEKDEIDTTRPICFVDAKISPAGYLLPPPDTEDYLAVPMVGEVGAGAGMIDQGELKSWVLVHSQSLAVRNRTNLLAVEIGRNQRSMIPTLHPEDIVLVNRDDYGQNGYKPPGNIFLVRDPGMDGGMVKRVSVTEKGTRSTITFYSDNPEYEPETYHLDEYDNDIKKAIVGRVVWSWTDMSRK